MNNKNKHNGQSLVEFALLLPIFFLLVMALFDVGRYVFYYAVLNTAAREGARFAIVLPLDDYNKSGNVGNYLSDATQDTPQVDEEIQLSNCTAGGSDAHDAICTQVKDSIFNLPTLSDGLLTISHSRDDIDRPMINIFLEIAFEPITPGLGLIGVTNISVDSQMQMIYARFPDL